MSRINISRWICQAVLCGLLFVAGTATAAEVFVDNRVGRDGFDGLSATPQGGRAGPVQTIRRAMQLLRPNDTITLVNTGEPYYESIELVGARHSGAPQYPFVLNGNGTVLSGARLVPPEVWQYVGDDVWRFRPYRKGHYQLLLEHAPLPEIRAAAGSTARPDLPAGHWCAWKGTIYYRAKIGAGETPPDLPLAFAHGSVGISLIDVRHVVIRDLTVRHFRLDGVNAHDRATQVILERVNLVENGRAGLAVSGTSLVGLKDSKCQRNRDAQLINAELGQTEIESSEFGTDPADAAGAIRILGGHVILDGQEVLPAR